VKWFFPYKNCGTRIFVECVMAVVRWFWSILKGALNTIARAVVILVLIFVALAVVGSASERDLPENMVLTLDLREDLQDKTAPDFFEFEVTEMSLVDVVLGLDAASRDERVSGIFLRVGAGDISVPKSEELREALRRFQDAGKFVIAHSQGFYSSGLGGFGVAALADEIWMQPASAFFAAGAASTTLFFRGLFDNIDAEPQFVQRHEYKNSANIFTETAFTPAHREATERILLSRYETATNQIAADLGIARDTLIGILDGSPLIVDEAVENGLVTSIGYDDDARDAALERAGAGAELAEFSTYVRENREARARADGPVVALVHAVGEIVEGTESGPLTSPMLIRGDDFAEAIRAATEDEDVRAILLRVDSPGGSAVASDQILDALNKAQAAGKPLVASMGALAASGGYYISLGADRIVANPGTITGSIGVLWGKVAAGGSLELIGVNSEELGVGANALFLSGLEPWSAEQLVEVNAQADAIYEDFTRKVADGRNMSEEQVDEVARGRVWTGADALERGLVDDLGGFWTAVDYVKELAEIDPETEVAFRQYPRRRGVFERLESMFEVSSAGIRALQGLDRILSLEPIQALLSAAYNAPRGRVELLAVGVP
jgi:protease-4